MLSKFVLIVCLILPTYTNYKVIEVKIDVAIDDLYYQDKIIRDIGSDNLLEIAYKSNPAKELVIEALAKVLKDKKLLTYQKEVRYKTWYQAVYLLGELKAVTTLDLLVDNLDYTNDKNSITENYYPALDAIVKIGDVAVPKLAKSLLENKNITIKTNIIRALDKIHSKAARQVLEEALALGKNPQLQHYIQVLLNNWEAV